jgi:hypothetical protein
MRFIEPHRAQISKWRLQISPDWSRFFDLWEWARQLRRGPYFLARIGFDGLPEHLS